MKFASLLAAGRSIINSAGKPTYRANKNIYLPKFDSAKNPFTSEVRMPLAESRPSAPTAPAPRPAGSTMSAFSSTVSKSAGWMAKFRPAPAAPVRHLRAEQTELSLDTVRVVGNDLTDSDNAPSAKSRAVRPQGALELVPEWTEASQMPVR